jgi:DNA-directed RNA polymerase subunit N (RpoN/RPB10)
LLIAPIQPVKCFNCREPGHISKECTKPRNSINDIEEGEPEFEEDEDILEDSGKADA